jgi:hypothetical protein
VIDDQNDALTLGEQDIRDAINNAEPPRGTIEWAKFIINRYEPQISGTGADITKVYELPYVEAAAIISIEEGDYYARLRQKLKGRGVRIGDWEGRVREAERRTKQQRRDEEKEAARHNTTIAPSGGQESQATQLVKLVIAAGAELFHDGDVGFAAIPLGTHTENHPLRSRMFRRWITKLFFTEYQRAPNAEGVQSAVNACDAKAAYEGAQFKTWIRLASCDGKLYLDLADELWRMVEITRDGWHIINAQPPPVRFRRPPGMLPLPAPVRGGSIYELRNYLNVASDDDFRLTVAWQLGCYREHGPFPILNLNGEQGTGKTTFARFLRDLVDPNIAPIRSEPRESRDLMISATNGWVCAFDNLSYLPTWLSDALCRLATGGGFSVRTNYTDDEETLFVAQRPVILNGIEELAVRGDLLERTINVELERIKPANRKAEAALYEAFYAARPGILGAFLGVVATALRRSHEVHLKELPRMADFSVWVVAAEPALESTPTNDPASGPTLKWKDGDFMAAYTRNRAAANRLPLEASPITEPIQQLKEGFSGTATELLSRLDSLVDEQKPKLRSWPRTPNRLSGILRRLAPHFAESGIEITFERVPGGRRQRLITIAHVLPEDKEPPPPKDEEPKNAGNPATEPPEDKKPSPPDSHHQPLEEGNPPSHSSPSSETQQNQELFPDESATRPSGLSSRKLDPEVRDATDKIPDATRDDNRSGKSPGESRVFDHRCSRDDKSRELSGGWSDRNTHTHNSNPGDANAKSTDSSNRSLVDSQSSNELHDGPQTNLATSQQRQQPVTEGIKRSW